MSITIEEVALVRHPTGTPIAWDDDAIGVLPNDNINIRIKLSGSPLPVAVTIKLESRAPNKSKTIATMPQPRWFSVVKTPAYGTGVYYHSLSLNDVGEFLKIQSPKVLELAMLHRPNEVIAGAASSHLMFQKGGNWVMKGVSELPRTPVPGTGSEQAERPGPTQLLRAGGVEVLQVTLKPPVGWKL